MQVKATKCSEAYVQLDSNDSGILREISEHFTFFVEGYKFMPAYKNKMWDGKLRLFDYGTRKLPHGLIHDLSEFCSTLGYTLDWKDPNTYHTEKEIREYILSLPLRASGKVISLYPYQVDAVVQALSHGRKILVSPTGSGKSLIIYCAIRFFQKCYSSDKVLLIVPTTSLVEQMYKDFGDYSSDDQTFDTQRDVHRIYAGLEKNVISARVTVTTWQSAITLGPAWFAPYRMVIGDEAHLFKAKSLTTIMGRLVNARYRIGTTGTLDGSQVHELVLTGVFGKAYNVISTKELIDTDILAQCFVNCLVLQYTPEEKKKLKAKATYMEEIDFLVSNPKRNSFITNVALSCQGNSLVLFNLVEKHGEPLFKMIFEKAGGTRKVFYVSGSVAVDERERIREITEKETTAIIVASMGTFSTGVNIRNLHNIVFAAPTKSQIRVLQSIGRGLRKAEDGRATTVYDITDDLSKGKGLNYTLRHGGERLKIYIKQKFKHKVIPVKIP